MKEHVFSRVEIPLSLIIAHNNLATNPKFACQSKILESSVQEVQRKKKTMNFEIYWHERMSRSNIDNKLKKLIEVSRRSAKNSEGTCLFARCNFFKFNNLKKKSV